LASTAILPDRTLVESLSQDGFVFVRGDAMRRALEPFGTVDDWTAFAASWNDLELDRHMADGGRYRRRRHAVFAAGAEGAIERQPHQPHYQALDYNPLNGGVARWFAPIADDVVGGRSLPTILEFSRALFTRLARVDAARHGRLGWKIEVHQFRIEAQPGNEGLPTPEGMHRDGVDFVLVLLVNRTNIASGTTSIHGPDGRELGRFTLTDPLDAALVDDARVAHGVTAVQAMDPNQPAYRDVLVATFKRNDVFGGPERPGPRT
jgi:hypothetical protein